MLITFWFVTKKLGYLDELKLSHSNGRLLKKIISHRYLKIDTSSKK
jgi:hypothetical protein